MQNIKLGFIGFGNMAQAMVKGLLLKEVLPAGSDLCLCEELGEIRADHRQLWSTSHAMMQER